MDELRFDYLLQDELIQRTWVLAPVVGPARIAGFVARKGEQRRLPSHAPAVQWLDENVGPCGSKSWYVSNQFIIIPDEAACFAFRMRWC